MAKNGIWKTVTDFLFYISGCLIYSSAVTLFVSANEISPGGITGISTAINHLSGIPSGIILLVFNIPILILGFVKFGKVFIARTAAVTVILSFCLDLTEALLPHIETDKILASVFGGILMGTGLSMVMSRGATTGGIDIIAKLINKKFRHITVGRVVLYADALVIAFAALVYRNIESALYSVISLYASSRIMDTVLYGADKGKILYIITSNPDEICRQIAEKLKRGTTKIKVMGGYKGENRIMLLCTVRRHEVSGVYSIINAVDNRAFVVAGEAGEIIGEGFKAINL